MNAKIYGICEETIITITVISKYYKLVRTKDVAPQVDRLPSMHKGPGFNLHKLGVVEGVTEPTYNPSTLDRIRGSRSSLATQFEASLGMNE